MSRITDFKTWYPDYGSYYSGFLTTTCADQYQHYLNNTDIQPCTEPTQGNCVLGPLLDCLISSANPTVTANTAAATVLMGLLPSLLLTIGSTLPEHSFFILRRPFLGTLLAACTPSVAPVRFGDYASSDKIFGGKASTLLHSDNRSVALVVLFLEYVLAIGAVVNIGTLMWQLTIQSTLAWANRFNNGSTVWLLIALVVHWLSAGTMALRVKVVDSTRRSKGLAGTLQTVLRRESTLSHEHGKKTTTHFWIRDESWVFYSLTWVVSTFAALNLVYGSVLLAGFLFISVKDALGIVVRFFVSALAARAILAYELSGMLRSIDISNKPSDDNVTYESPQHNFQTEDISYDSQAYEMAPSKVRGTH